MINKIAFMGAGRMATAMISGILNKKYLSPESICCTSANDGTGEKLAERTGIGFTLDHKELMQDADILVLAIKPQQLNQMKELPDDLTANCLIISILAGTPISKLKNIFPKAKNIVRAMPNTPGQIGYGITAYASDCSLSPEEQDSVSHILGSMGKVIAVDEVDIDAVTAVSGSGPAYVFEFVAALRDASIAAGLNEEISYQLALQTTLGASQLLAQSAESPEDLRNAVSSPGGTTLAGLRIMDNAHFRTLIKDTVAAAKARSIELANS